MGLVLKTFSSIAGFIPSLPKLITYKMIRFLGVFSTFAMLLLVSCSVKPGKFESTTVPSAPDYSALYYWAAHPDKEDPSDKVPDLAMASEEAKAGVDVFFIHPTIFSGKSKNWNANLHDEQLNKETDNSTILHQSSIFNAAGRVFAPRYRQAHLRAFFTEDKKSASEALNLAYEDVALAFRYYLDHWNQGRPIIIAAHSQGALHAVRLLKEFFDGKPLGEKLVVAYIVGWPVAIDEFKDIPLCQNPTQTKCFCSWRTVKNGYYPKGAPKGDSIAVVNPLTWNTSSEPAGLELNKGSVLKQFKLVKPGLADAQISNGFLWTHKPHFPGSFLITNRNYHIADYNFYYVNVRENAMLRAKSFFHAASE